MNGVVVIIVTGVFLYLAYTEGRMAKERDIAAELRKTMKRLDPETRNKLMIEMLMNEDEQEV